MKKIGILLILAVVASVFLLVGCKSASESPQDATNTTQQ